MRDFYVKTFLNKLPKNGLNRLTLFIGVKWFLVHETIANDKECLVTLCINFFFIEVEVFSFDQLVLEA